MQMTQNIVVKEISIHDIRVGTILGQGAFATVYNCTYSGAAKQYNALKVFDPL